MRATPLPLIGGFYADETRPWSQQDICNWLPVATESEGTRTPTMAKTPPGLSPFVDTGNSDPVRAVYNAEGRLFSVAGNTAYQISNAGVAIPLGAISGVGRVRCAHNQITGGNEVLFVNGSAGWVWNTASSTLTQVTDAGYPGAINAAFIDGYIIQIEPARRYAFHSDLADALSYNTLDRFTSEVSPDLLVSLAVSNNELILFSESSTEFFENTGATQQPFRSKRISFQKGCAGRYTVASMDNTVFWLGDDGSFYMLEGYSPKRISTRPIEQAIRALNWAQAFAYVWEDSGHAVCYWTFPDGLTFGYDASQQKWHRRASYGFDRWRLADLAYWQSRWIGGDFQSGRLWELDWAYPLEGDQEFISEITSPVIHDNQSRVLMPRMEVVMDTGQPEVAARDFPPQPDGPVISGSAPDATIGSAYSYAYTLTPGDAEITSCVVASGTLPTGLSLSSSGVLSGTCGVEAASFTFTIRATDGNSLWYELSDTVSLTLTGALPITITRTSLGGLAGGGVSEAYQQLQNSYPSVTDATGPWARIQCLGRSVSSTSVPPEIRFIVYDGINQGGDEFFNSGWFGNSANQAGLDAALVTAGLSAYQGTIANTTLNNPGTGAQWYQSYSDVFTLPSDFATHSGRTVGYNSQGSRDFNVLLQAPTPAQIPPGAVKVLAHPGYYLASGQLYVCNWVNGP